MSTLAFCVIAGTPGAGKTAVLSHLVRELLKRKCRPAAVKIDCLRTDDDARLSRLGIPVRLGLSMDMCPDHFAIYNTEAMIRWAVSEKADVLLNETAGLCLRCAPYSEEALAVCVIDVTAGPNTPLKIGPLLTEADVVCLTKGDMVSQAEREVFRERVAEVNPACRLIEANGLTGKGAGELADLLMGHRPVDEKEEISLRCSPPFSICTLCAGEKRVAEKYHRGLLRRLDSTSRYSGE